MNVGEALMQVDSLLKLTDAMAADPQVDDLKAKLASQEVELAQKNEDANKLIQVVGAEQEKVGKEKAIADEEEAKVSKITVEVEAKQADCARDLAKAEPALKAAVEALNTLNKVSVLIQSVKLLVSFFSKLCSWWSLGLEGDIICASYLWVREWLCRPILDLQSRTQSGHWKFAFVAGIQAAKWQRSLADCA